MGDIFGHFGVSLFEVQYGASDGLCPWFEFSFRFGERKVKSPATVSHRLSAGGLLGFPDQGELDVTDRNSLVCGFAEISFS